MHHRDIERKQLDTLNGRDPDRPSGGAKDAITFPYQVFGGGAADAGRGASDEYNFLVVHGRPRFKGRVAGKQGQGILIFLQFCPPCELSSVVRSDGRDAECNPCFISKTTA
jgi:hypothetical protein